MPQTILLKQMEVGWIPSAERISVLGPHSANLSLLEQEVSFRKCRPELEEEGWKLVYCEEIGPCPSCTRDLPFYRDDPHPSSG